MANLPSLSLLSVSAPAFSNSTATSPFPSLMAWCKAVIPSISVALMGLLCSSNNFTIGTLPMAAALCNGSCPRLSFVLAEAPCLSSVLQTSRLPLETAKCSAVAPQFVGTLGSASFDSSRSMVASPLLSFKLAAIASGVHPEPSCASGSNDRVDARSFTMST